MGICKILLSSFVKKDLKLFWAKYFKSQQKQPSLNVVRITTYIIKGNCEEVTT